MRRATGRLAWAVPIPVDVSVNDKPTAHLGTPSLVTPTLPALAALTKLPSVRRSSFSSSSAVGGPASIGPATDDPFFPRSRLAPTGCSGGTVCCAAGQFCQGTTTCCNAGQIGCGEGCCNFGETCCGSKCCGGGTTCDNGECKPPYDGYVTPTPSTTSRTSSTSVTSSTSSSSNTPPSYGPGPSRTVTPSYSNPYGSSVTISIPSYTIPNYGGFTPTPSCNDNNHQVVVVGAAVGACLGAFALIMAALAAWLWRKNRACEAELAGYRPTPTQPPAEEPKPTYNEPTPAPPKPEEPSYGNNGTQPTQPGYGNTDTQPTQPGYGSTPAPPPANNY
ncbi:hypothetical protein M408DRAFT_28107 [Serendipita vermifera MAFF 305830]|uniref:Uncharacterized protein n=1 Tax=Serendipita vermifera MAFF 305830 TaxID=933852 RepID=A0A0C3AVD7_SERVB|nr:hypothetical protein M408DRAFT_28107 [Serendipita vermifera MAFF 305830]